jgi:DNA-binding NtrC family response regulator
MRILIVDDDEGCRECLEAALEYRGHQVTAASTYEGAVLVLSERVGPDAVVTDGDLNGKASGLDLLTHCRKIGLPVVLLSGREELVEMAHQVGYAALLKPYENVDRVLALLAVEMGRW